MLIGGGEAAESALKETAKDLGSRLRVLGETESSNAEEISQYTQDILNEYRKEVEVILCSTEDRALAAADGVQLRHRLVGRDILVVGTSAHEETCEAIINKLMSGSTFTDFYEQASLTAVAAKDLIEGNLPEKMISNVVFKVTEENAQEVLDLLWKTRTALESRDAGRPERRPQRQRRKRAVPLRLLQRRQPKRAVPLRLPQKRQRKKLVHQRSLQKQPVHRRSLRRRRR